MDDKLILCVFNFPELYNVTLPNYRCTKSRNTAWRNISTVVGLPYDECKRKWKNLRDRYLKEVRLELQTKQQGALVPSRWKYRQLLNFLAPFAGTRHSGTADDSGGDGNNDNESGEGELETPEAASVAATKTTSGQVDTKAQAAFMSQLAPATQLAQLAFLAKLPLGTRVAPLAANPVRKRRAPPAQPSPGTKTARGKDGVPSPPPKPRDEDEMFLLSFVPALKRLSPQKRCATKIKIQRVMYEAEFNAEQPTSRENETKSETETHRD